MDRKGKKFLALKAKWDKKLKQDGFQDIENPDGTLKVWHSFAFGREGTPPGPAKEEYYRLAGQFLYDHKFASRVEKRMWELHSNGISIIKIATIITNEFSYMYKRKVHTTLQRLSKEMLNKCRNQRY